MPEDGDTGRPRLQPRLDSFATVMLISPMVSVQVCMPRADHPLWTRGLLLPPTLTAALQPRHSLEAGQLSCCAVPQHAIV